MRRLDASTVVALLRRHGFRYFVDDEGDVGGLWEGARVYFPVRGGAQEMLFVRAYYDRRLDASRRVEVMALLDEWNRERVYPKVYSSLDDSGALRVMGEVALDCEPGVTLDYLHHMIGVSVATALQFGEFLDARL